MPRNNPQIWRLATWFHNDLREDYQSPLLEEPVVPLHDCSGEVQNFYYDRAIELLKKLENRDFTGPDLHKD